MRISSRLYFPAFFRSPIVLYSFFKVALRNFRLAYIVFLKTTQSCAHYWSLLSLCWFPSTMPPLFRAGRIPRRCFASFSDSDPVSLAYDLHRAPSSGSTRQGQGPLVILHGLYGSKQNWRSLSKALAQATGRNVYALVRIESGSAVVIWLAKAAFACLYGCLADNCASGSAKPWDKSALGR